MAQILASTWLKYSLTFTCWTRFSAEKPQQLQQSTVLFAKSFLSSTTRNDNKAKETSKSWSLLFVSLVHFRYHFSDTKKAITLQYFRIFRSQVSTIISKTACPAYQTAQGAYQLNISPSHYAKHLQTILVHMEKYIFSQLMSAHQQVPQYLPLFVWNRVGSL